MAFYCCRCEEKSILAHSHTPRGWQVSCKALGTDRPQQRYPTWSADPTSTPHAIELDAALDNALCSEDLPLALWY
eukprot:COSAG01_NODE_160_length_23692_cov_9.703599_29_plen_75_part_00